MKQAQHVVVLTEKIEVLAAKLEALQSRPPLVVGKRAHARDPREMDKLPVMWKTVCGSWRYGCASFLRAGEDHEAARCLRCFPQTAGSVDESRASSASESEDSGSETESSSESSCSS